MDLHPAESGRSSLSPEATKPPAPSAERAPSGRDQGVADHLHAAMLETGVSYRALATALDVAKTTAAALVDGMKPLRWDHIRAMPSALKVRFLTRLLDEATAERDAKRPSRDVDSNLRNVVVRQGEYVQKIVEAKADGVIDAHEVPGIVRCGNEYADAVRLAVRDVAAEAGR